MDDSITLGDGIIHYHYCNYLITIHSHELRITSYAYCPIPGNLKFFEIHEIMNDFITLTA